MISDLMSTRSRCHRGLEYLVPVLDSGLKGSETRNVETDAQGQPPQVKALLLSACLFSTITSFQVWAAYLAKSRALLMDCTMAAMAQVVGGCAIWEGISSAVDALTFIGNVAVECRKRDGRRHPCSQLMVVATSLGLLTFFTIRALGESYGKVLVCQEHGRNSEGDDDDVNGWITLGFALGNMLFDIICLVNFLKSHKQTGSGKHANMFSAFLHVGADFLRAFTALVLSLLILICTSWDSTCLDAYCSLVIGVTILCGVLVGLQKWICLLLSLLFADAIFCFGSAAVNALIEFFRARDFNQVGLAALSGMGVVVLLFFTFKVNLLATFHGNFFVTPFAQCMGRGVILTASLVGAILSHLMSQGCTGFIGAGANIGFLTGNLILSCLTGQWKHSLGNIAMIGAMTLTIWFSPILWRQQFLMMCGGLGLLMLPQRGVMRVAFSFLLLIVSMAGLELVYAFYRGNELAYWEAFCQANGLWKNSAKLAQKTQKLVHFREAPGKSG
ncbi:unnamed protein product [Cladocopium goreaui]|uniref:Transmembrane protein 163 n=1 Tax=Cladocopium goreaui TaxID=2562237 RepID=A0A9P1DHA6_9DINO|nr:unnamed protein product [Cladocopium goreaui]